MGGEMCGQGSDYYQIWPESSLLVTTVNMSPTMTFAQFAIGVDYTYDDCNTDRVRTPRLDASVTVEPTRTTN